MPYVTTNRPIRRGYNTFEDDGFSYSGFLRTSAKIMGEALLEGTDISDVYSAPAEYYEMSVGDFEHVKKAAERARKAQLEFDIMMNVAQNRRVINAIESAAMSFNLTPEEVAAIVKDMIKE